ncbi:putative amino acid transporter, transmembrane domain-containing protein [Heracleum sosnowskyi]|uniref:Amino acid transporter, transmembrane domain-containing protein n=1 Tax=Heracleum sosnowskyi TaxID=360622 RepID=A0AAD8MYR9_9APIA|nr:putative amino acid transporter, transmembrane domain-containing protein [Heracleum sosnowskyi]
MVTATTHIITSVIGSGVLSLAWAVAQLGWIAGSFSLCLFSLITLFTSHLLADCYRSSLSGKRNYSYMDVVNSNLAIPLSSFNNVKTIVGSLLPAIKPPIVTHSCAEGLMNQHGPPST